jgi:2-keto-4-pentenoate hydratase/2-oxohepta-3-ene-1,7-dioic acid hydratase in catechol pathway
MNIFCIGRNYVEHAKELGNEVPEEPVIFIKPHTALLQPGATFHYPSFTKDLHYECELVLKICKQGKNISENEARGYYDQITLGIDFTARDVQNELKKKGLPWEKAKAWDNAAVVGNWKALPADADCKNISFIMNKNGALVQKGNSGQMINSFDKIISHISIYFSLNPGDFIFTGTPAGVGPCVQGDELEGFYENESLFKVAVN